MERLRKKGYLVRKKEERAFRYAPRVAQADVMRGLVRDFVELYEPVAEERGMKLVLDVAEGTTIIANRQLVGQAVANLIDNAIKYSAKTKDPVIRITMRADGEAVEIAVADRGPGIAPDDRERVLRRFVRLEKSRTEPGTGLGLSLVQAVARLHGGGVRLEDNAPGLRVVLRIPKRPGDR